MRPKTVTAPTLLAALCALLASCGTVGGGEAACAAHATTLDTEPSRVAAGGSFRISGEGFADYSGRDGLSREECPSPLPEQGIAVQFVQGERTWGLARVDGDDGLAFEAVLEVPEDAEPGEAVVRATSRGEGLAQASPPAEAPILVLAPPSEGAADAGAERCIPLELFDAPGPITRIDPDVICE